MKTLAELIDEFAAERGKREALQEKVVACTNRMTTLESDILQAMSAAGITQAGSTMATATMKKVTRPSIKDWSEFHAYVAATGAFELLHKRLSTTAFQERWDAGEVVPGTDKSEAWEVSIRRK